MAYTHTRWKYVEGNFVRNDGVKVWMNMNLGWSITDSSGKNVLRGPGRKRASEIQSFDCLANAISTADYLFALPYVA